MGGFTSRITQGVGQSIKSLFKGGPEVARDTEAGKPNKNDIYPPGYPQHEEKEKRILWLAQKFYREGSFEKIQLARKWMRNSLMLQGYHELDWSEVNVAWDALIRDSGDFAFPNNYYRSHIKNGASLYIQNEPRFDIAPASDDYEAQAISKAAKTALEIIKENVQFDYLRVLEAIYLRLYGNSFRYAYYSLDPRYGHITAPVYQEKDITIGNGIWGPCPQCGGMGEGMPNVCPQCGNALPVDAVHPPLKSKVPQKMGQVSYPRGQEQCEIVSPMQCGTRSSSPNIYVTPYFYRARIVDRIALQGDFADVDIMTNGRLGTNDDEGSGSAYAAAGDLALVYDQSLADLPGDPTQYAAWYERATSYSRCFYLQMWMRPAQYRFDEELSEDYPDGIGADIADMGTLLEAKNDSIDDHWTHFGYNFVPGRFWWDGDDDLIPGQLKLNETDRLIMRNQAYNSVPQKVVDKQRIDVDQITNDPEELIICKVGGRPVNEAIMNLEGQQLPQEVWQWRATQLQDMEYHSGVFGSSIGAHDPGVNSFGGQEFMASKTEQAMSPMLLVFKEANEQWARQMLKIAANNWLDDRVKTTMGINGQWEFKKLRGRMLQLDKVKVTAAVIPVDYTEQQSFSQAVASGVLNPQDPRVQQKALELYNLPKELSSFSADAKVQWDEIDQMKQGQQVMPMLLRDNHQVHFEICRDWLISDEGRYAPQEIQAMVYQHMQQHMIQMATMQKVQMAIAGSGQEGQQDQGQPGEDQSQQQGGASGVRQPNAGQGATQGGRRGGQVPASSAARQGRAQRGAAAKPHRPQPPGGNQYKVGRRGSSPGRGR